MASIGVISASLCAPALPFIADHFALKFSYIQFTISLFLIGNAFGQFLSGPLSDQVGQRTVLLGGLILYTLASCGCALSEEMSILLGGRFFQGMGSAVGPVLARAIASSSFPLDRSAQVQSYGAMGVGFVSMFAILGSGQITLVSWRGNFWLAAGLGVLLLSWALAALKKSPTHLLKKISWKPIILSMKEVGKHPHFLKNALCHSLTYGLMYGYIGLFPFMLMALFHEKNPAQVGLYSAYMIAFYMLGAFVAAKLVPRWSTNRMIYAGLLLQLVSGALLAVSGSSPLFLGALFLFNISIGMILPLTAAGALAPFAKQSVGTASSSLGLSYRLIGALLSMLVCQLPLAEGRSLGLAILLLSLGSILLCRYMPQVSAEA